MSRPEHPIESLPAWSSLNDVDFFDVKVEGVLDKGFGLVAETQLAREEDTFDIPILLRIPHKLILCAEGVKLYAQVDHLFRQLLDAAGHKVSPTRCYDYAVAVGLSFSGSQTDTTFSCTF
jgi:hypothetical protein